MSEEIAPQTATESPTKAEPVPPRGHRPLPAPRPTALALRVFALALIAWWAGAWWLGIATASGRRWGGPVPGEAFAQLRSIERRLSPRAAERMAGFFFEGRLFAYSFYGFAVCNVATALPPDHPYRAHALREIERILPIVEELGRTVPFNTCQNIEPRGGIIAAGHRNLLRAGYALLGGTRPDILADYHTETAALHDLFTTGTLPVLESYPHEYWPVDNCCALESLRLHDALYGTAYSDACRRFGDWLRAHEDSRTGLLPSEIAANGTTTDGPRGCALSWSLAFLPALAPDLAREQYDRYRSTMFAHPWGTTGIREWPAGRSGSMDPDSGPVFYGIGAGASGLGIAAARANRDWDNLRGLLRALDIVAFPVRTLWGEKRYLGGQVILGETLALWGKTMRPWDAPPQAAAAPDSPWPAAPSPGFWLPLLVIGALGLALTALAAWDSIRLLRRLGDRRHLRTWTRAEGHLVGMQIAALLIWVTVPACNWLVAVAVLWGLGIVGWFQSPPLARH